MNAPAGSGGVMSEPTLEGLIREIAAKEVEKKLSQSEEARLLAEAERPAQMEINKEAPVARFCPVYLRAADIARIIGVNQRTIFKWTREGTFPKPISFSSRCTVWAIEPVLGWINGKRAREGLPPLTSDSVFQPV